MPVITAHTGCMNTIDNSMESLHAALKYNCEVVEIDVNLTSDEILVLNHDDEVEDENNHRFLLQDTNFGTLCKIRQKNGLQGIVTVREFLEEAKGKISVNLDIKSIDCILPVVKLIKELKIETQVVMTGCELDKISYNKEHGVEIRYMFNANAFLRRATRSAYENTLSTALKFGCGGINISFKLAKREFVTMAHSIYMPVCVWTVNTAEDAKNVIAADVDSITTRAPDMIRKVLTLS